MLHYSSNFSVGLKYLCIINWNKKDRVITWVSATKGRERSVLRVHGALVRNRPGHEDGNQVVRGNK